MKNKLLFIVLAGMLLSVTKTAIAGSESESYLGVQYGVGIYEEDDISEDFKPTALIVRLGWNFMPDFSIEGRFGVGMQDDTQSLSEFSGLDATLELDSIYGVYGTGRLKLTESLSIYGVLGASRVKGTANLSDYPEIKVTESNSGVSYGVGADFAVGSDVALNIEYMQYLDKPDYDFGAIALGVVFNY